MWTGGIYVGCCSGEAAEAERWPGGRHQWTVDESTWCGRPERQHNCISQFHHCLHVCFLCMSKAVFDLPYPNLHLGWIQWNRPFSAWIRICESSFDADSLAKLEVLSSKWHHSNINKQQWRHTGPRPRIQTTRFASESEFGFTMNLNLQGGSKNVSCCTVIDISKVRQ